MRVIAYDPFIAPETAQKLDVELVELDELLERADAISVHVPKTQDTTGLLGAEAFRKMKRGVLVVNAARGGIVDEAALLEALERRPRGGRRPRRLRARSRRRRTTRWCTTSG